MSGMTSMTLHGSDQTLDLHASPLAGLDSGFDATESQFSAWEQRQPSPFADDSAVGSPGVMPAVLRPLYFTGNCSDDCSDNAERCDIHRSTFQGPDGLNSTNLTYYAGNVGWSLVLTEATKRFIRNTLLLNAFPDRGVDLPEAALALASARGAVALNGYRLSPRLSLTPP